MKKILIVATVQSHIAQFHKSFIKELQYKGYEVHVAARNNLADKKGLELSEPNIIFDIDFSRSPFSIKNIKALKLLRKIISNYDYDIIHCHTPMGSVIARLANNNSKAKMIYTAHGFHFYKGAPLLNWLLYYPVEKWLSKKTDLIITINKEDYSLASKKFIKTKVEYINGVGIEKSKFDNPINLSLKNQIPNIDNPFIVSVIGELNNNKNQIFLIKEFKKIIKIHPRIVLLIIGNGPNERKYMKEIVKNGLNQNIKLLGYRTDIPSILNESDLVISASKREGQGINMIEAMMSSKIVLASINRGHRDLINSGENGYLFSLKKKRDFIEKFCFIYEKFKSLDKVKEKAYEESKQYLSININHKLLRIYNRIMSNY